jgi:hypothetical protein
VRIVAACIVSACVTRARSGRRWRNGWGRIFHVSTPPHAPLPSHGRQERCWPAGRAPRGRGARESRGRRGDIPRSHWPAGGRPHRRSLHAVPHVLPAGRGHGGAAAAAATRRQARRPMPLFSTGLGRWPRAGRAVACVCALRGRVCTCSAAARASARRRALRGRVGGADLLRLDAALPTGRSRADSGASHALPQSGTSAGGRCAG